MYPSTDPSSLRWFKSSYSGGSSSECVETAITDTEGIYVRDSKRPDDAVIAVSGAAWTAFLAGAAH